MTVTAFVAPARALARSMAAKESPAYMYHFTRVPPGRRRRRLGAFHGLEIVYVFGNLPKIGFEDADRNLSVAMTGYWTRFAATGDPNPPAGARAVRWPAYDDRTEPYIEFGDAIRVKTGLYRAECDAIDKAI